MTKKRFLKFLIAVFFLLLSENQPSFTQTPMPPPQTLLVEGAEKLPEELYKDFQRSADWTCANFLGWTSDKKAVGYNEYYKPFILEKPGLEPLKIDVFLPDPENLAIQPINSLSYLFTKDNNGDENAQLFHYEIAPKKVSQLTKKPEINFVNSYLWSVDGKSIYFINEKKKENLAELLKLDPTTKKLEKLTTLNGYTHYLKAINQDNLIYSRYISNQQTEYYLFNFLTKTIAKISSAQAFYSMAKFSFNGKGIWWLSNENGKFNDFYHYEIETKSVKKLNKTELNIADFAVSPDEKLVALKINDLGTEKIELYELKDLQIGLQIDSPKLNNGVVSNLSWRNIDEIGFGFESHRNAPKILTYNVRNQNLETWAQGEASQPLINQIRETKIIKWKSFDEREISGLLLQPKTFGEGRTKFPVLIDIHGGPKDQYQPYFNSYFTYYTAGLKIVTIFPNIRGSKGFGKEFEDLDNKEKRENAVKDLQALLDWVKNQPELDADNVFVKGASYGGFVALALGLKEQNRIKGIIAEQPIISIRNLLTKSGNLRDIYEAEYGSLDNSELLEKNEQLSTLYPNNLNNWKTPLFITVGQNDVRTVPQDAEELKEKLKAKNIPVWFFKATNEGHFWSNPKNFNYVRMEEMMFIVKYAK